VPPAVLAQLVELPTTQVEELCEELAAEYQREGRGFQLARVAGGYRFQTHPDAHAYVERFVLEGQTARLSGPALETLAIIAYKQPIARAHISAIRGVNVDATLKTLVARGYVEESGHEHTPGNPTLFSTTSAFLERLGVNSLADLPPLADFVPESSLVEALERGLRGVDVEVELDEPGEQPEP
jgi:segregation and condensation protein B